MEYSNTKIKRDNLRIIIEPDLWRVDFASQIEECESIIKDIKRHVDYIVGCDIDFDEEIVCCFCDSPPECEGNTGIPSCCEQAVDFYIKENDTQEQEDITKLEREE